MAAVAFDVPWKAPHRTIGKMHQRTNMGTPPKQQKGLTHNLAIYRNKCGCHYMFDKKPALLGIKKKNPNKCPKLPQHTSLTEVFPASSSVTVTQQILLRAGQCGEIKTLHSPWQVMWHTFACDTQICECGHEDKIQDWFI